MKYSCVQADKVKRTLPWDLLELGATINLQRELFCKLGSQKEHQIPAPGLRKAGRRAGGTWRWRQCRGRLWLLGPCTGSSGECWCAAQSLVKMLGSVCWWGSPRLERCEAGNAEPALETETQMLPRCKAGGRRAFPGEEMMAFLSGVRWHVLPFPGRGFPRLDLGPPLCMALERHLLLRYRPWEPCRVLLYPLLTMCFVLWQCSNRTFLCLDFCPFHSFVYRPLRSFPIITQIYPLLFTCCS